MTELISSKAFREAAMAGALSAPVVVGVAGGYILEAKVGHIRKQLSARSASGEQSCRVFTSIQSAASSFSRKPGFSLSWSTQPNTAQVRHH